MFIPRITVTAAVMAIAVMSGLAPAQAATRPALAETASAGTATGIGFGNSLNGATAIMHSASHAGTYYVGTAHSGDNLATVLHVPLLDVPK